jgi:hypothetical protein
MRPIQRIIEAGFATAAIASASIPALAWTVWPDVDFEWYANVGKPLDSRTIEIAAAPAPSHSWGPSTPAAQPTLLAREQDRRDPTLASASPARGQSPVPDSPRREAAPR